MKKRLKKFKSEYGYYFRDKMNIPQGTVFYTIIKYELYGNEKEILGKRLRFFKNNIVNGIDIKIEYESKTTN